jgi:hypothetical protein
MPLGVFWQLEEACWRAYYVVCGDESTPFGNIGNVGYDRKFRLPRAGFCSRPSGRPARQQSAGETMTGMSKDRLIGLVLTLSLACYLVLFNASLAAADVLRLPQNFYHKPDRDAVDALFKQLVANPTLGVSSNVGRRIGIFRTMGFVARVATDNPEWIADWRPALIKLDKGLLLVMALAIAAGSSEESNETLEFLAVSGHQKIIEIVRKQDPKSLLKFEVLNPDILNTFEGAYRASGDHYFLEQILKGFAISLPMGKGPKKLNALMSHLIPATMIALYRTDNRARKWFDGQIALNAYDLGDLVANIVRAKNIQEKKN